MPTLDFAGDARRAFATLKAGGIGILPMDVGYSLIGGTGPALKKIFDTKRRAPSKLNAMLGNDDMHRDLHVVSPRAHDIYNAIVHDYDLPLGVIAPCRPDHPFLRALDADTYARSTRDDTLLMLVNAGRFHAALTGISHAEGHLLFGSSANISLTGTKFRGADIEPEIRAIADIVIDYGLVKYHPWNASSTLLNIETGAVYRHGVAFENIADILKRHFKVELPPRPAKP